MATEAQATGLVTTTTGAALRWIVPIAGVALLAVLFVQIGPERIVGLARAIGADMLVVTGIFAAHECVRALAVGRCLLDQRPPLRTLLWIRFMGEAVRTLTHTGPFLAEPARAWMLARQGLHGPRAYGGAIAELIANVTTSAMVTLLVLAYALVALDLGARIEALSRVLVWISLGFVGVVAVALARRVYVIGAILRGLGALPFVGRRLRTNPGHVRQMEDSILAVLSDRPAVLAQVLLLEIVAQAILVLEIYWAIGAMDLPITYGRALVVEALTKLVNVVQFIGATEGGYAVVFGWLGMAAAAGFTLSLVKRARSLIVAAAGLGVLALVGRSRPGPAAEARRP